MTTKLQTQGLGEFARMGFILEARNDHTAELYHEGEEIATFSQVGATEESMRKECADHLIKYHHWDGCLWEKGK